MCPHCWRWSQLIALPDWFERDASVDLNQSAALQRLLLYALAISALRKRALNALGDAGQLQTSMRNRPGFASMRRHCVHIAIQFVASSDSARQPIELRQLLLTRWGDLVNHGTAFDSRVDAVAGPYEA